MLFLSKRLITYYKEYMVNEIEITSLNIFPTKEQTILQGYQIAWSGARTPERIMITDPNDPEKRKTLIDEKVGYMRDGIVVSRVGILIGTYERTIDHEQQDDGTYLNEIIFYPIHDKE